MGRGGRKSQVQRKKKPVTLEGPGLYNQPELLKTDQAPPPHWHLLDALEMSGDSEPRADCRTQTTQSWQQRLRPFTALPLGSAHLSDLGFLFFKMGIMKTI